MQRRLLTDRAWDAMMRSQFPSPKRRVADLKLAVA